MRLERIKAEEKWWEDRKKAFEAGGGVCPEGFEKILFNKKYHTFFGGKCMNTKKFDSSEDEGEVPFNKGHL
jgi:hypothetical protein